MNQITRHTPRWLQSDVFGSPDPGFLWPVSRLHREMNRLFSDAFRGLDEDTERPGEWAFDPVVDVEQDDRQYEITVELPGVSMSDISVEMKEDMLLISGSKERRKTTGEGRQQRSERVYGSFRRSFRLPEDALEENINARFADGLLTVTIPRDESRSRGESRRIEVQPAPGSRETIEHESSAGERAGTPHTGTREGGGRAAKERSSAGSE